MKHSNDCREARLDARHRLACPACRAGARADAAWKTFGDDVRVSVGTDSAPEDEAFVRRVLAADRRRRSRSRMRRTWLAAAAAAFFFFVAGLSRETASAPAPAPGDSLTALAAPDDLAELLPD